jgi:hypothetical protein
VQHSLQLYESPLYRQSGAAEQSERKESNRKAEGSHEAAQIAAAASLSFSFSFSFAAASPVMSQDLASRTDFVVHICFLCEWKEEEEDKN